MKLKLTILILSALLVAPAAGYCAALSMEEAACASEDMQLLYYYLAPEPGQAVKERATECHGARTTLKMPDWLEKELPAMLERKVWKDPEEGDLSEAQVWQTAFSILYELSATTKKTLPNAQGGAAVPVSKLDASFDDIRLRFIMSVDRLTRADTGNSFGGRGAALLSTMNMSMKHLDALTDAIAEDDKEGFDKNAGEISKLSRDLFAQLFEAPRAFTFKYLPKARMVPGYRGTSLKVSGSQVMFLKSGDRADMLVTFEAVMGSGAKEKVTATILQNVVVVKVFRPASPSEPGVVQLLCNPNEAQYAALSLAQGSNIVIARRAAGDVELRPMEIASFRKLFK